MCVCVFMRVWVGVWVVGGGWWCGGAGGGWEGREKVEVGVEGESQQLKPSDIKHYVAINVFSWSTVCELQSQIDKKCSKTRNITNSLQHNVALLACTIHSWLEGLHSLVPKLQQKEPGQEDLWHAK